MRHVVSFFFATTLAISCSSRYVSVNRMAYYPPREEGCPLEFVKTDMRQISPGGEWEVVGMIAIGETGVADPFAEKYRKIVRPHACQMGGEAVTLLQSMANQTSMGSSSGINYAILRRPTAPAASPQKF